jgi:crotonobetainyl-CoA:carnitine CoA-transferase CaiB-like acyl-CoA transferase
VQSEAGLLSITGTSDEPCRTGISVADIAAGMYTYSGVLAALLARIRTGAGAVIEVSLFDALAEWMSAPAYYAAYGAAPPARTGANHASIAPYGPFRSEDGFTIVLAVQNAREWERFCRLVLEQPSLADDPMFHTNPLRVEHRDALTQAIAEVFGRMTGATLGDRLDAARIAYSRLNTMADFLAHPQLSLRNGWADIASPAGPIRALRPPTRIAGCEAVMGAIPELGQHTDTILEELGFERAGIAAWRREGMV